MVRFILTIIIFTFSSPAMAGELTACGTPQEPDAGVSTDDQCDFQSRRFQYYDSHKEFEKQIEARREDFYAPEKQMNDAYKEQLKAHHEKIGASQP